MCRGSCGDCNRYSPGPPELDGVNGRRGGNGLSGGAARPGNPNFVQVGTTSTGTSYNDTGLVAGSAYSYRVRATDIAQNLSDYSGVASVTTLAGNGASDNFNRADGDLGANWTKPLASENNLVIVNNQVGVDTEDSYNYAFWSADSFSEDQVLADYGYENGLLAGRNRSGGWSSDRFYLGF